MSAPSSPDALGRLGRGSALNLAGGAVATVVTLALTVLLTRSLDPEAVGGFFTATSLFLLLAALGQLGTSTGLVYALGRVEASERRREGPAFVRVAAGPVALVALLTAVGLVALASPLADLVDGGPDLAAALRWLGVATPFAAALAVLTTATRGIGAMGPTVVIDQVGRSLLQLVLVGAALSADRPDLVVPAWALPYVPAAGAALLAWRRRTERGTDPAPAARDPERARAFWRFTIPRALAGVAQVALQRLDIVLVATLADLRAAAIYTAATRFLVLGQVVGTAIGRSVQPRLARALARDDLATAGEMYRTGTGWQVLLCWPVYLVLAVAATPVLRIFGDAYTEGASVVVVLALTMLVATACGTVDVVLTMAGRSTWSLANTLAAFAVNVGLNLLLIPRLGILGAAIAWSAAILLSNLLPLAQVRRTTGLHPFGRGTLIAIAIAAAGLGMLPGAVTLLGGSTGAVLAAVVVGALLAAGAAWAAREPLRLAALRPGSPIP